MVIDLRARFERPGTRFWRDPAVFPEQPGEPVAEATMGDIVHLPEAGLELEVDVVAAAPIERLELFNGTELVETVRPYRNGELGRRVRVLFEGATYRGRAREVIWDGSARFPGNRVLKADAVNFFNPDQPLERVDERELRWRALTTGNFAGFDVWLEHGRGRLEIETPLIEGALELDDLGLEDRVLDASGVLPRMIRIFRLPERLATTSLRLNRQVALIRSGDNPIYIRLTLEDGTRAWTSPIYVFRG